MPFFFDTTVQQYPSSPAIINAQGTEPYNRFAHSVYNIAVALHERGIAPGDRVGILASPSTGTLALFMALFRSGAVAVPISTRFPAQQIAQTLHSVQCRLVVVSEDCRPAAAALHIPTVAIEALLLTQNSTIELPAAHHTDADATILFTSGSTGAPKAVVHSMGAHIHSARGSQHNIPLGTNDCWLLSLPLFHTGGLAIAIRVFLAGAALALPTPGAPLIETLREFPLTHLSLVATQLYRLLHDREGAALLRNLKAILLGGSAIPPSLIERSLDAGLRIYTSYGCTEMASQITTTRFISAEELATSGRLLPGRELKVDNSTSEILVRGATLFRGYANGFALHTATDEQGWYHTRDTGFFDSEGRLHVTGRIDNMFISGGENIQPEEIEQALCSLPHILQALVVPVPDTEFGARPVAFLWLANDTPFDEHTTRAQLAERIARFKIPTRFVIEAPTAEHTGKLNRADYRRKAVLIHTTT